MLLTWTRLHVQRLNYQSPLSPGRDRNLIRSPVFYDWVGTILSLSFQQSNFSLSDADFCTSKYPEHLQKVWLGFFTGSDRINVSKGESSSFPEQQVSEEVEL